MEPLEIFGNLETGETSIRLSDGKVRRMIFDTGALRTLEHTLHQPWDRALVFPKSMTTLVAYIFAGCQAHAIKSGEEWSLTIVQDLIKVKDFSRLWLQTDWSRSVVYKQYAEGAKALAGELKAAAPKAQSGRRGRGKGR